MTPPATLHGRAGRGYAVVESLPSLGKGRRCTGVFLVEAEARAALEAARADGERVTFRGVVHHRHRSGEAEVGVEITRVEAEGEGLRVEFSTWDVPYDVVG